MLEIKNLSFGYKNKPVLNNLNLTIYNGEVFGVLGMNGAGKTTFFESLFLNNKFEGKIHFRNEPIKKNLMSYAETEPYFYPYMKCKEYLSFFMFKDATYNWNEYFSFDMEVYAENLSTGNKKKLELTGATLLNRKVYILDEPFNGLDFQSVEKLYLLIQHLKNLGKIVIISSHIMETLEICCDNIGILNNGSFESIYSKENFYLYKESVRASMIV